MLMNKKSLIPVCLDPKHAKYLSDCERAIKYNRLFTERFDCIKIIENYRK